MLSLLSRIFRTTKFTCGFDSISLMTLTSEQVAFVCCWLPLPCSLIKLMLCSDVCQSAHIATNARKANLLDPNRCPPDMKILMKDRVNACDSFEATGLSLTILNLPEFWAEDCFVQTTHEQWVSLCKTSAESSTICLGQLFARSAAGKPFAASSYRSFARRIAVFCNLRAGSAVAAAFVDL
jgi:hypothetical protein